MKIFATFNRQTKNISSYFHAFTIKCCLFQSLSVPQCITGQWPSARTSQACTSDSRAPSGPEPLSCLKLLLRLRCWYTTGEMPRNSPRNAKRNAMSAVRKKVKSKTSKCFEFGALRLALCGVLCGISPVMYQRLNRGYWRIHSSTRKY